MPENQRRGFFLDQIDVYRRKSNAFNHIVNLIKYSRFKYLHSIKLFCKGVPYLHFLINGLHHKQQDQHPDQLGIPI
ncbi:hypothetical protein ALC56_00935 [Trachymyrmex septentrionalis]|uniref:Uncharacterized protein n=1 Tax=Trachymyrmex septentrionalis TaxID=34720 RepID=A0A195FVZ7_9HYME|nr:hypothetical protein ALC56_00935 [Trachymyrmex septentrionalis]